MQPTQVNNQPPLNQDKNLLIIFAVTLMAVIGVASVTPAFPQLAVALKVSPQNIGWLITIFTFPTVILSPIIGVLAD